MTQQFDQKELIKKSASLSQWYTDVLLKAQLADYAPVKGTMVIRPYGYAIWEKVQEIFNQMIKAHGVENAYFPLFIPYSLLEKETEHVEGFSPELALVTIGGGEKLKDPLVVRPTSETIICVMYAKWVKSWRDLPILINLWNNVVRWEKRTYLFLRTTEFLWQEGHTAHQTEKEAMEMVYTALEWYRQVYEDYLAVPVLLGLKSSSEKFAGAKLTYTVEALMPDGKALQGATSHNLGQNFSKAFDIRFQNKAGKLDYVWQTSWGLTTRSLGGLFLTHGDDRGLILPPKVAPVQVVIIPILNKAAGRVQKSTAPLVTYVCDIEAELSDSGVRVRIDPKSEFMNGEEYSETVGRKFHKWELKGVPLRFEIGDRERKAKTVTVVRRDTGEKMTLARTELQKKIPQLLEDMQRSLFGKAKQFLADHTHEVSSYDEFKKIMETTRGFLRAFWCEDEACAAQIKQDTKATTRCLPLDARAEKGQCVRCGKPATQRWVFGQSY